MEKNYINKRLYYIKKELYREELHKEKIIQKDYMKWNLYFSCIHLPTLLHSYLR